MLHYCIVIVSLTYSCFLMWWKFMTFSLTDRFCLEDLFTLRVCSFDSSCLKVRYTFSLYSQEMYEFSQLCWSCIFGFLSQEEYSSWHVPPICYWGIVYCPKEESTIIAIKWKEASRNIGEKFRFHNFDWC